MKKNLRVCTQEGHRDWISRLARDWRVAKNGTHVKHAGELKSQASYCITGQNFQSCQAVSLRLKLATSSSCELESPEHPVWL